MTGGARSCPQDLAAAVSAIEEILREDADHRAGWFRYHRTMHAGYTQTTFDTEGVPA